MVYFMSYQSREGYGLCNELTKEEGYGLCNELTKVERVMIYVMSKQSRSRVIVFVMNKSR